MRNSRDTNEISCLLKYALFFFNLVVWLGSSLLIAISVYAYIDKDKYSVNEQEDDGNIDIYDIIFDLTIIFMIVGSALFIISFLGCVGALRENTIFLNIFALIIGFIFLLEVVGAILAFVFKDAIIESVQRGLKVESIERYRDDPDFHDLINWAQEQFDCCGVSDKGYTDWNRNEYFRCFDDEGNDAINRSPDKCGVPYSCCIDPDNINKGVINTMCGYGVQAQSETSAAEVIHTQGCVQAMVDWTESNLIVIGGVAIGVAVHQLIGILLARVLVQQIKANKYKAGIR